jgi:hypothetical protein
MRKLNEKDAQDWSYNDGQGILVAVPKDRLGEKSELYFLTSDKFNCDDIALNTEDETNGLTTGDFMLNLLEYDLFLCDDMREFCEWYLRSSRIQADIKTLVSRNPVKLNKEDKEWIHEKCGTNTPPPFAPEHPSKGNKQQPINIPRELPKEIQKHFESVPPTGMEIPEGVNPDASLISDGENLKEIKLTRRERLKDILTLLDFTHRIDKLTEMIGSYHPLSIPQHLVDELSDVRKEMDEWLDEV